MPSIIKFSTCVIVPDKEFLMPNCVPILPREVMAVGKCLMVSSELFNKKYYGNLIDGENVLVVDPNNLEQYSKVIEEVIRDPEIALRIGEKAYQHSIQFENFNEYVDFTIGFYRKLLNNL